MKYTVTYTELIGRTFIVDADNEEEAEKKVFDAVENGFIFLTENDYFDDSGKIADCWHSTDDDADFYPTLESFYPSLESFMD